MDFSLELRTARRATNTWRAAAADRLAALALVGRGVAALVGSLSGVRSARGSSTRAHALATARLRAVHARASDGRRARVVHPAAHATMARAHAEKLKLATASATPTGGSPASAEDRAVGRPFEHWARLRRVAAALRDGGRRRRAFSARGRRRRRSAPP